MKRILLLAAVLFLSPFSLMAEGDASDNASIESDCRQTGTDIGLKGQDLADYVTECVAANMEAPAAGGEEKSE
ncbi:MAG: hypothetical protein OEW89_02940 [Gammaproteobacteria bacterium]|nr:hypothetical protein [Gammaproteobacteria bacterium]MDH5593579.1 hypothetical protein [Gammaproteobacteria bacterium]